MHIDRDFVQRILARYDPKLFNRWMFDSAADNRPLSNHLGLPVVMVPVLSRRMVSRRVAFSRASAFLNRMPFSAPLPGRP